MNDREREAYLNRIGYEGELRTDKKCLEKIMEPVSYTHLTLPTT